MSSFCKPWCIGLSLPWQCIRCPSQGKDKGRGGNKVKEERKSRIEKKEEMWKLGKKDKIEKKMKIPFSFLLLMWLKNFQISKSGDLRTRDLSQVRAQAREIEAWLTQELVSILCHNCLHFSNTKGKLSDGTDFYVGTHYLLSSLHGSPHLILQQP